MKERRISKNIYGKNGILLVAAGQTVTDNMLRRLEFLNIDIEKEKTGDFDEAFIYRNDVKNRADMLKQTLKINNTKLFNTAAEVLEIIIFEGKNEPWWIYVKAISNYVKWIYAHAIDVSLISVMLAQAMGIKNRLEDIALGAFFHDIGKLLIPKKILLKTSMLTDEEKYYVRQHCDLGISILKEHELSQISLDIICQHHEKLDGSGYPQGLEDIQIPVHSRIAIVAEKIDALTSYRPYKPMMHIESAIMELKKQKEKYPVDIINAFCSLM